MGSRGREMRFIFASLLCWGFGLSLYIYVQPLYVAYLGASPEQIGLALSIGSVLGLSLSVPMARAADQIGRRRVMIAGWSLGAVATASMAVAPDWRWLVPLFAVRQISSATMPALYGYVATNNGAGNPSAAFGQVWLGFTLGEIIGPAVGGWIGELAGMRALYWSAAFFFLLSTLFIVKVSEQPTVTKERRVKTRGLLSLGGFRQLVILTVLIFFAINVGYVMLPNYLQDVRGLSLAQIGQFGTIGSLGVAFLLAAMNRFGPERKMPLLVGQLLPILALMLWTQSSAPLLIAFGYFIHGRNRLVQPFLDGRLSLMLDQDSLNVGYGIREMAMRIGLAAAPLAAGFLYVKRPGLPLQVGMAVLTLTIALTWVLPPRAVEGLA